MTDINFYVSKQEGIEQRFSIVFKLITMALKRKMAIHIHTSDENESKLLDEYLWKHQKTSFIPHSIMSNNVPNSKQEISIGHNYEPMNHCDYLVNLSTERPDFFSRYLKFAEILDTSEEILTAGRKRYAFYRDRGYTLEYYQL
jgi:DNA polymerase-3 subunit chi